MIISYNLLYFLLLFLFFFFFTFYWIHTTFPFIEYSLLDFYIFYILVGKEENTLYNVIVFPYSVSTTFRFLISRVSYRDITALREIWDPSIVEMVVRRVTESSLVGGSCAQTLEYVKD